MIRTIFGFIFLMQCFTLMANTTVPEDSGRIPIIVITDLYHPFQDPGDNLDMVSTFALQEFDLKAVFLDITDAFRKPVADHHTLWKDPRGPREAGIIPVMQLNYIFGRNVPWAIGPMSMMKEEYDKMLCAPPFEQEGIEKFLEILSETKGKIEILSFGSARILAVAYNRNPELLLNKVAKIYLSAGTASPNYQLGKDQGANMIPGGEWNVALDVFAFTRLLRSNLPVAIFPCAGIDGGFIKDTNNTYWQLPDMHFINDLDERLKRYVDYAFASKLQHDFLRAVDDDGSQQILNAELYSSPFHFWEPPVWIIASRRSLVMRKNGLYRIVSEKERLPTDRIISNYLRPCSLTVRDDGRFLFEYTNDSSNFSIFVRDDPQEHEKALQEAYPYLLKSYMTK